MYVENVMENSLLRGYILWLILCVADKILLILFSFLVLKNIYLRFFFVNNINHLHNVRTVISHFNLKFSFEFLDLYYFVNDICIADICCNT